MKANPLAFVQLLARVVAIACFPLFLLPLLLPSASAASYLAIAAAVDHGISLYRTAGLPQFSAEWAARAFSDPAAQFLMLALLVLLLRQHFMLPLFSLVIVAVPQVAQTAFPMLPASLKQSLAGPVEQLMQRLTNNLTWQSLPAATKWSSAFSKALHLSCTAQVMHGVFLVVNLLLPSRSLIGLFAFWQFLQLRYLLDQSGYVKQAFKSTDQQLLSVLSHPYCPGLLGTLYGYVKTFLASQIQAAQNPQQNQQASPLSRCTIM